MTRAGTQMEYAKALVEYHDDVTTGDGKCELVARHPTPNPSTPIPQSESAKPLNPQTPSPLVLESLNPKPLTLKPLNP